MLINCRRHRRCLCLCLSSVSAVSLARFRLHFSINQSINSGAVSSASTAAGSSLMPQCPQPRESAAAIPMPRPPLGAISYDICQQQARNAKKLKIISWLRRKRRKAMWNVKCECEFPTSLIGVCWRRPRPNRRSAPRQITLSLPALSPLAQRLVELAALAHFKAISSTWFLINLPYPRLLPPCPLHPLFEWVPHNLRLRFVPSLFAHLRKWPLAWAKFFSSKRRQRDGRPSAPQGMHHWPSIVFRLKSHSAVNTSANTAAVNTPTCVCEYTRICRAFSFNLNRKRGNLLRHVDHMSRAMWKAISPKREAASEGSLMSYWK